MHAKETLKQLKAGEEKNFSDNPCYPVVVRKISDDMFRFPDGSVYSLLNATRRLRPVGYEIYG